MKHEFPHIQFYKSFVLIIADIFEEMLRFGPDHSSRIRTRLLKLSICRMRVRLLEYVITLVVY